MINILYLQELQKCFFGLGNVLLKLATPFAHSERIFLLRKITNV